MTDDLYLIALAAALAGEEAEEDDERRRRNIPVQYWGAATIPDEEEDEMLSNTVTLLHADIANLPTLPFELVPAPGANKIIVPFGFVFNKSSYQADYVTTDGDYIIVSYAEGETFYLNRGLFRDDAAGVGLTALSAGTDNRIFFDWPGIYSPASGYYDPVTASNNSSGVNKALQLRASAGGNFAGGHANNTFTVTTYYAIADV
jgi:hypothetical protein